jgi:hypothetical protein
MRFRTLDGWLTSLRVIRNLHCGLLNDEAACRALGVNLVTC